jgi:hypothetical protein
MAIEVINVGTTPNDGTGDGLRTAYIKCNNNFAFLNTFISNYAPTFNTGSVGDSEGQLAYDSSYLYVCFQDYDGSSAIWGRIALDTSW